MKKTGNRWKKIISVWALAFLLALGAPGLKAKAASASVSVSGGTAAPGEQVKVTVTVKGDVNLGSLDAEITYDSTVLKYVSASGDGQINGTGGVLAWSWYETGTSYSSTKSCSLTFEAVTAGTANVKAQLTDASDSEANVISLNSGSGTVTVKQSEQKPATNVNLSSLSVSPGSLSPAFSPDQTSYTMTVGPDQERIVVTAPAADAENTRVNISGATKLKVGTNTVTITVTAKDGSGSKKYTIKVTREESAEVPSTGEGEPSSESPSESESETAVPVTGVTIDGKTWQFVTDFSTVTWPEGFEESTYSYKGTEVTVGKGITQNLILFALTDGSEGSVPELFIYDETLDSFIPYVSVTVSQKMYTILPIPSDLSIPAGYEATIVTIDGKEVDGFTNTMEQEDGCYLVYAMNWNGETGLYRYDSKEGTMQRISSSLGFGTEEEQYEAMKQELEQLKAQKGQKETFLFYCTIGFAAFSIVELFLLISLLLKRRQEREEEEEITEEIPDLEAAILAEAGLSEISEEPELPEAESEQDSEKEAEAGEAVTDGMEELAVTTVEEPDFEFFEEEELAEEAAESEETSEPGEISKPEETSQPEESSKEEEMPLPEASEEAPEPLKEEPDSEDIEFFDL